MGMGSNNNTEGCENQPKLVPSYFVCIHCDVYVISFCSCSNSTPQSRKNRDIGSNAVVAELHQTIAVVPMVRSKYYGRYPLDGLEGKERKETLLVLLMIVQIFDRKQLFDW